MSNNALLISTCDLLLAQSCMLASMRDFAKMVTHISPSNSDVTKCNGVM